MNYSLTSKIPPDEFALISCIEARSQKLHCWVLGTEIAMVHYYGCGLDLEEFLHSNDDDFFHDAIGIRANLNRETGELLDNWLPRSARKETV